jgi:hypothetical protein
MDTMYADAGTAVHEAIAEYYSMISPSPHGGVIEGTFSSILDRYWKAASLEKMVKLKSRREKCEENFIKFEKKRLNTWRQYKPTVVEEMIRARIHGINYVTIPDAYWETDSTVVNWKTGGISYLTEKEFVQGHIERMVLRSNGRRVNEYIFVALLTGLELRLPMLDDKYVEDRIETLIQYERTNKFPKHRGDACRYCAHSLRCQLQDRGWHLWT